MKDVSASNYHEGSWVEKVSAQIFKVSKCLKLYDVYSSFIWTSIQKLKHPLRSFQVRISRTISFEVFRGMWQKPPPSGLCLEKTPAPCVTLPTLNQAVSAISIKCGRKVFFSSSLQGFVFKYNLSKFCFKGINFHRKVLYYWAQMRQT